MLSPYRHYGYCVFWQFTPNSVQSRQLSKYLISRINDTASILSSKAWLRVTDSGFIFCVIRLLWCLKLHLECIIEWYLKNIAEVGVFAYQNIDVLRNGAKKRVALRFRCICAFLLMFQLVFLLCSLSPPIYYFKKIN